MNTSLLIPSKVDLDAKPVCFMTYPTSIIKNIGAIALVDKIKLSKKLLLVKNYVSVDSAVIITEITVIIIEAK